MRIIDLLERGIIALESLAISHMNMTDPMLHVEHKAKTEDSQAGLSMAAIKEAQREAAEEWGRRPYPTGQNPKTIPYDAVTRQDPPMTIADSIRAKARESKR